MDHGPVPCPELDVASRQLARQLFRDDMSRADEVPLVREGRKAYSTWLRAASDARDRDTLEALEAVDEDVFAAEWDRLVAREVV